MKKSLDDVLEIIRNNYSDPKPSIEDLRINSLIFDDSLIRWGARDQKHLILSKRYEVNKTIFKMRHP